MEEICSFSLFLPAPLSRSSVLFSSAVSPGAHTRTRTRKSTTQFFVFLKASSDMGRGLGLQQAEGSPPVPHRSSCSPERHSGTSAASEQRLHHLSGHQPRSVGLTEAQQRFPLSFLLLEKPDLFVEVT